MSGICDDWGRNRRTSWAKKRLQGLVMKFLQWTTMPSSDWQVEMTGQRQIQREGRQRQRCLKLSNTLTAWFFSNSNSLVPPPIRRKRPVICWGILWVYLFVSRWIEQNWTASGTPKTSASSRVGIFRVWVVLNGVMCILRRHHFATLSAWPLVCLNWLHTAAEARFVVLNSFSGV